MVGVLTVKIAKNKIYIVKIVQCMNMTKIE